MRGPSSWGDRIQCIAPLLQLMGHISVCCHIGSGCTITRSNDCVSGGPSEPMFRTIVMRLLGPPSRFMASNRRRAGVGAAEALVSSFRKHQAGYPCATLWPRMVYIWLKVAIGRIGAVMSNEFDWDFSDPDDAKANSQRH